MRINSKMIMWIGCFTILLSSAGICQEQSNKEQNSDTDNLYYRVTFSIPSKTRQSFVKGTYRVKDGERLITEGQFKLEGMTTESDRTFEAPIMPMDSVRWDNCYLQWEIKCSVFDSKLNDTFDASGWNASGFGRPVAGLGYHVVLHPSKQMEVRAKYYPLEKNNNE